MRGRFAIAIVAALMMAACGPRYAVYDGGLAPYEGPEEAPELQPTEAVAIFSTEYAPPEENVPYGGPTNRVRVLVPEGPERRFLLMSASGGLISIRQSSPVRGRTGAAAIAANVDSMPAQALVEEREPGKLVRRHQGIKVSTASAPLADYAMSEHVTEQESEHIRASADSSGAAQRTSDAGALAVDHSKAPRHPVQSEASAAAQTSEASWRQQGVGAGRSYAGPSAFAGNSGTLVPARGVLSTAARDAGIAEKPFPVQTSVASLKSRNSENAAMAAGAGGAKGLADIETGKLMAHRDTAAYLESSDARIVARTSVASAVYEQLGREEMLQETLRSRQGTRSVAPARRSGAAEALALAQAEAAAFKKDPRGLMEALTSEGVEGRTGAASLKTGADVTVAQEVSAVSPPWLSVRLVGRLMREGDIEKLLEDGVIPRRPDAPFLIQYRFYVFNYSDSVAADVSIVNRLDPVTPFFAAAGSRAGDITYGAGKHAVTATADRLDPQKGLMFEFYVEAP